MDPVLLLLTVLVAIVTGGPLLLMRRTQASELRALRWRGEMAWPAAVATLGLAETEPESPSEVGRARGQVDGFEVELVVTVSGLGLGLRHQLELTLDADPGFSARRRRRDGDGGVLIGEPDLDAALRFATDDPRRLRLLCDAPTRAALHQTVGRGAVLEGGHLTLVLDRSVSDPAVTASGLVQAARALARCARQLALDWDPRERLLAGLEDPEWRVRLRALRALIADRDPDLPEALELAFEDEHAAVRLTAALESDRIPELERLHRERHLVDLVQHPEPELRTAAAEAYTLVGALEDVDLLLEVARRPRSSGGPRAAIEEAVDAIRARHPGGKGRLALEAPETGTLSLARCG